jgi:hypothetical protein
MYNSLFVEISGFFHIFSSIISLGVNSESCAAFSILQSITTAAVNVE